MTQIIERFLLLLLPTQLGYHFWPPWSLVHGIRVDYLSPTLYFTDILIFLLFLISNFRLRIPAYAIAFAVLNVLLSYSPHIAIYNWLRLLEYFWLFKYLTSSAPYSLFLIRNSLSIAVIWTSFLAWSQFLKQASIGSLLYWLGERTFNINTPGIAKIDLFNLGFVLRPYATLPHPNALAGFLLVSGLIIYYLTNITSVLRSPPLTAKPRAASENLRGGWGVILSKASIFVAALTIPVTFSRSAIVLETLVVGYFLISKLKSLTFKFLIVILTFAFCLLNIAYGNPSSLPDRLSLIRNSLFVIRNSPLFGVGLGNFIPASSNYQLTVGEFSTINYQLITQPVHNIYLLLASELGLPALFVISYLTLKKIFQISNFKFQIAVLVVLVTGLLDHYWLTLHQNRLLLTFLISIIYIKSFSHEQ
ncbi:O-antigen ligase family protein [Candidatus Amesbacteria bacterium]|nr:O-antigen ligase family protein [Candidatus Amesbacteria bacterium]